MNVVLIGGGSGISTIAPHFLGRGLKLLTAIVTVADDGGHTGELRREVEIDGKRIAGVGDARKVIASLAQTPEITARLEKREGNKCQGNLEIVAEIKKCRNFELGIQRLGRKVLREGCEVIPVTAQSTRLVAVLSDGTFLRKEHRIGSRPLNDERAIEEIRLEPPVMATQTALDRIMGANLVVIGPGSLHTSIVPNLVVGGVPEALRKTDAKLVSIVNLFTNPSETRGYNAPKFVSVIVRYTRRKFDLVLCNDASLISSEILGRYLSEQDSEAMEYDPEDELQRSMLETYAKEVLMSNFLDKKRELLARHSKKVVQRMFDWYGSVVAAEALVPAEEICQTV